MSPRPSPRSRQEQKAQTREALLSAARRCYRRRGYVATSIADIVKEAKVAQGTFYVHFSSQQEVFDQLLSAFNQEMVLALQPLFLDGPSLSWESLIPKVAEAFLGHLEKHRPLAHAFVERSAQLELTHLRDGLNPPMHQLLCLALERRLSALGVRPRQDLSLVATGILGLWFRLSLRYLFGETSQKQQVANTLVSLTRGALAPLFEGAPVRRR